MSVPGKLPVASEVAVNVNVPLPSLLQADDRIDTVSKPIVVTSVNAANGAADDGLAKPTVEATDRAMDNAPRRRHGVRADRSTDVGRRSCEADSLRDDSAGSRSEALGPLTNVQILAGSLRAELERGLSTTDDRWAVAAAALVAPPPVAADGFDAEAAVAELTAVGLVEGSPRSFSTVGSQLAVTLGQLVTIGALDVNAVAGERRIPVGMLTTLVSPTDRWVGVWLAGPEGLRIRLYRANRALALRLLSDLITAPIDPSAATAHATP